MWYWAGVTLLALATFTAMVEGAILREFKVGKELAVMPPMTPEEAETNDRIGNIWFLLVVLTIVFFVAGVTIITW